MLLTGNITLDIIDRKINRFLIKMNSTNKSNNKLKLINTKNNSDLIINDLLVDVIYESKKITI